MACDWIKPCESNKFRHVLHIKRVLSPSELKIPTLPSYDFASMTPHSQDRHAGQRSQINCWVQNEKGSYNRIESDLNNPGGDDEDDAHSTSSMSSTKSLELHSTSGDALLPKSTTTDRIFADGRATWLQLIKLARSLSRGFLPDYDPAIMLKDVPALPNFIPKHGVLAGRPLWHVPNAQDEKSGDERNKDWDMRYLFGALKQYTLSFPQPIECLTTSSPSSSNKHTSHATKGLLVLTLCWSYILSARFSELQRKKILYSPHTLRPKTAKASCARQGEVNIHLSASTSHKLVKWLCAILAPRPGWLVEGGGFPPWATFCSGDIHFVISTDGPVTFDDDERPPSCAHATELLTELCRYYGLGNNNFNSDFDKSLSPYTTAFLAALALPFSRLIGLQPRFPIPILEGRSTDITDTASLQPIQQYVADLRYYMTLSMHPRSLESVLWSIFWQPDVECNVVSFWLASILDVLRPAINSHDFVLLSQIFILRRPRVGLWWVGVFVLGDPSILTLITRYLDTLDASMASSDPVSSSWTGSPHSFLDGNDSSIYIDLDDPVPIMEVLRHRNNFRLQDTSSTPLSWRPFGHIKKREVEVELWPGLERGYSREYVHWVWWIRRDHGIVNRDIQLGFRKDTGRFISGIPDHLERKRTRGFAKCIVDIKLEPSLQSTLRMIHYCMEDATGDRDTAISIIPGAKVHPWLKGWRGLE